MLSSPIKTDEVYTIAESNKIDKAIREKSGGIELYLKNLKEKQNKHKFNNQYNYNVTYKFA